MLGHLKAASARQPRARLCVGQPRSARGFGIVEGLVVVSVPGPITAAAMLSFLESRAIEGLAQQFVADLQYPRSEAVRCNESAAATAEIERVVVRLDSDTAEGTTTNAVVSPAEAGLKWVRPGDAGARLLQFTLRPTGGLAQVRLEPVSSTSACIGTAAGPCSASWQVAGGAGAPGLRIDVKPMGRVRECLPTGSSFPGHATCP